MDKKKMWTPNLHWLIDSEAKGFLMLGLNYILFAIVFHFVILGLLERTELFSFLSEFSGFKKFLVSAGVFYAVLLIHSIPKLYMIPSIMFSAMDGLLLHTFVCYIASTRFNIKIDESSLPSIVIYIVCILLFIHRYHNIRFGTILNYDTPEQSEANIEYKMKHDKWYRENRMYWAAKDRGINVKSMKEMEPTIYDDLMRK